MNLDPSLLLVAATAFALTVLGVLFRYLRQSVLIAYLLAGVLLGPHALGVFDDPTVLTPLADMGLILLLFFVGLEVDLGLLSTQWRIAIVGTTLQTLISVGVVWIVGDFLDWPMARIVLMGFVIALSSTPIALRFLSDRGLLSTRTGVNTLGILVAQDLLSIPMLIILRAFEGESLSATLLTLQIASGLAVVGIIILAVRHAGFRIPLVRHIEASRELQVLAALALCFGTALITGLMQLSSVLGGFVAAILIRLSGSLSWVRATLEPIGFTLIAVFFVSVGTLIDLEFSFVEFWPVIGLTVIALLLNTLVNGATLLILGENWRDALVVAASLAQLGEFGFVLAGLGLATGVISETGYQYVLTVTALTWIVSPPWVLLIIRLTKNGQSGGADETENQAASSGESRGAAGRLS